MLMNATLKNLRFSPGWRSPIVPTLGRLPFIVLLPLRGWRRTCWRIIFPSSSRVNRMGVFLMFIKFLLRILPSAKNWHSDQFHCARAVARLRTCVSVSDGRNSVETMFWSVLTPSLWWRQPLRQMQKLSQIGIWLETVLHGLVNTKRVWMGQKWNALRNNKETRGRS